MVLIKVTETLTKASFISVFSKKLKKGLPFCVDVRRVVMLLKKDFKKQLI